MLIGGASLKRGFRSRWNCRFECARPHQLRWSRRTGVLAEGLWRSSIAVTGCRGNRLRVARLRPWRQPHSCSVARTKHGFYFGTILGETMRPQRKGRRKEHNSGNSTKSNDQQKRDILIELRKGTLLKSFDNAIPFMLTLLRAGGTLIE